ncbi:hypothetical protein PBI_SCTP2_385 [Salicola phage SCTP-2]|nr:hypothetical protein PBI_SCTP2_385 [Salicola phage SCTP-2]
MKIQDLILNESDNIDKLKELLENDFSEAYAQYKKGYGIYKGFGDNEPDNFKIMNPLEGRISRNTANFYNLIINEAPWWEEYPDRSVICTTNPDYARNFGTVYTVFPKNGSKIGVCPKRDIWHNASFDLPMKDLNTYIDLLEELSEMLGKSFEGFETYKDLVNTVKKFDNKQTNVRENLIKSFPEIENIKDTIINDGLYNFIKTNFTPTKFDLTSTSNFKYNIKDHKEVWFDNQFLAVYGDIMIDSGL